MTKATKIRAADSRRNFKVKIPERNIEVAGQIAAVFQHKQEHDGHDKLQQELRDSGQAEIALILKAQIIRKADMPG